jgi:RNA polymerase sigma-70 factor (ECF subfamily)
VSEFFDEAVLVKALVERDPNAFVYLLDRYHPMLVRLARQYVPSVAVAEEVAQETWIAVIEGIDRFEQRSAFKTWLFRILVNVARTHAMRERRTIPFASTAVFGEEPSVEAGRFRRLTLHGRGTWKEPPHPWSDPEQRVLDAEMMEFVERAVEQLAPEQREVFTMRDLLGWNAAEVCDALELSDANQRVLLHRARSKVRAALERQYGQARRV